VAGFFIACCMVVGCGVVVVGCMVVVVVGCVVVVMVAGCMVVGCVVVGCVVMVVVAACAWRWLHAPGCDMQGLQWAAVVSGGGMRAAR
jgi:hypothetical protein